MAADPAPPTVVLNRVSFWYPGAEAPRSPTLADLSLIVGPGEFLLLCGPSGSGKSTLLRLLLGLVPQFSGGSLQGSVTVLGRDPTLTPPREMAAAGVGLLFQNPAEGFVAERVGEEVAFGAENLGLPADEVDSRVAASLEAVGLADFGACRLRNLSDGQQQRVALAAALVLQPRLLLLDEPTAHLDDGTARSILALVARVARATAATVILSEHRLGSAAPLADRAVVLANGGILADGPPRAVFAEPAVMEVGVPIPRASRVAVRIGLPSPLPLTPAELAPRVTAAPEPPTGRQSGGDLVAETRPATPRLVFHEMTFAYATTPILDRITFTLGAGEAVALVGPSGAGKSTLARLALGLLRPTGGGQIELGGLPTDRTPLSRLAEVGGLVLQNPLHQLLAARVDEELRLGLAGLPAGEVHERVDRLLRAFDLVDLRERHPLALSEGQRRRVALAAVLVRRPRVLILDEPTLGQDERQRQVLVDLILSLTHGGTTVLAISHDPEFVNDACDRVLLLRDGRLTHDLPLDLARTDPELLHAAGLPLADIPATSLLLRESGQPVAARHLEDLVGWLYPIDPALTR